VLGPSRTAEVVACMRALETRRGTGLLDDPHAAGFLSPPFILTLALGRASGLVDGLWKGWPGIGNFVVVRHRWFDDRLRRAIERGVQHVLILGAGYDSRCKRIPGPTYWEVDHPATARRKRRISPDHPARRVDVDFATQQLTDQLIEAGFPVGVPVFAIWEGVTMYLSRQAVCGTLHALHELLGPGSELVFDAFQVVDDPGIEGHAHRLSPTLMPLVGEPVTFFIHPADMGDFLHRQGWSIDELADASALRSALCPDRVVYRPMYVVRCSRGDPTQETLPF